MSIVSHIQLNDMHAYRFRYRGDQLYYYSYRWLIDHRIQASLVWTGYLKVKMPEIEGYTALPTVGILFHNLPRKYAMTESNCSFGNDNLAIKERGI